MNSVHLVTREKYRVETRPKTESGAPKHLTWPSCAHQTRTGRPAGRPARSCLSLPLSPARPCRVRTPAALPARLLQRPVRLLQRPVRLLPLAQPAGRSACRAPASSAHPLRLARPAACNARPRAQASPAPVSWPCVRAGMAVSWPASRHSAARPPSPLSQYTHCIAIQNSCCQPSPIAIQCNILRYNPQPLHLSCNTPYPLAIQIFFFHNIKWAVAHQIFCTKFFFFVFSL